MREYTTPYKWIIVAFWDSNSAEDHVFKVFATWAGGFDSGDSWKLSSGISKVSVEGDLILFENYSGSTYRVHKEGYGTTMYSLSIVKQQEELFKNRIDGYKMRILTEDEAAKFVFEKSLQ